MKGWERHSVRILAYLRGNDTPVRSMIPSRTVEREQGTVWFLAAAVEARKVSLRKNGRFNN
jgi:hypothetical protein